MRNQSATTADYRYLTQDHLGSTRGMWDASATQTGSWEFTPYGASYLFAGPPDVTQLYTGHDLDRVTGQYYAPFRYLEPGLGRWLKQDPLGMVDGTNMFRYALNSPVNFVDRDGLDVWLEGPCDKEPSFHQSVCVGDPFGEHNCYSFGVNGNGMEGEVYRDTSSGGKIQKYKSTTADEDREFKNRMEKELGQTGTYGWDDICRSYSQRKWRQAPGKVVNPPDRKIRPQDEGSVSSSCSRSSTGGSSTSGTGTSR